MPIYGYQCTKCDKTLKEFRAIRQRNKKTVCPVCSQLMKRSIQLEQSRDFNLDYAHPVLSDSMGVAPSQVQEHRKRFPDIPITDDGRIICRNHTEHKRIMKQLGYFDKNGYY